MWNPFKKREHTGHDLDDEDRALSAEIRKIRKETRIAEEKAKLVDAQADLADAEARLNPPEEEMSPGMLMMMAALGLSPQMLQGQLPIPQTPPAPAPAAAPLKHYTDDELKKMLDAIPRTQRKMLRAVPEEMFRSKARELYQADDDSIDRALVIVRG